jgi:hypothetical protein
MKRIIVLILILCLQFSEISLKVNKSKTKKTKTYYYITDKFHNTNNVVGKYLLCTQESIQTKIKSRLEKFENELKQANKTDKGYQIAIKKYKKKIGKLKLYRINSTTNKIKKERLQNLGIFSHHSINDQVDSWSFGKGSTLFQSENIFYTNALRLFYLKNHILYLIYKFLTKTVILENEKIKSYRFNVDKLKLFKQKGIKKVFKEATTEALEKMLQSLKFLEEININKTNYKNVNLRRLLKYIKNYNNFSKVLELSGKVKSDEIKAIKLIQKINPKLLIFILEISNIQLLTKLKESLDSIQETNDKEFFDKLFRNDISFSEIIMLEEILSAGDLIKDKLIELIKGEGFKNLTNNFEELFKKLWSNANEDSCIIQKIYDYAANSEPIKELNKKLDELETTVKEKCNILPKKVKQPVEKGLHKLEKEKNKIQPALNLVSLTISKENEFSKNIIDYSNCFLDNLGLILGTDKKRKSKKINQILNKGKEVLSCREEEVEENEKYRADILSKLGKYNLIDKETFNSFKLIFSDSSDDKIEKFKSFFYIFQSEEKYKHLKEITSLGEDELKLLNKDSNFIDNLQYVDKDKLNDINVNFNFVEFINNSITLEEAYELREIVETSITEINENSYKHLRNLVSNTKLIDEIIELEMKLKADDFVYSFSSLFELIEQIDGLSDSFVIPFQEVKIVTTLDIVKQKIIEFPDAIATAATNLKNKLLNYE